MRCTNANALNSLGQGPSKVMRSMLRFFFVFKVVQSRLFTTCKLFLTLNYECMWEHSYYLSIICHLRLFSILEPNNGNTILCFVLK